jgi:uncharacterized protein (DUF1697 family)
MDTFIALYRGVNVVGKNSVKMESLRAMHERLGHKDVRSYIQSGNVVFSASGTAEGIARKVAAAFVKDFAFSPKVLIVDADKWRKYMKSNPYTKFAAKNPTTVHAAICVGEPDAKGLKALLAKTGGTEAFTIRYGIVYLHAPDGYGTSKFAAGMEKACGVPMTVRNWRTMEAIWKMTGAAGTSGKS